LLALRPAFEAHEVLFATTLEGLPQISQISPSVIIPDCNRNAVWLLPKAVVIIAYQIIRFRPHAIITTGALPGLIALAIGRAFGVQTVWIDSLANADEMSMSGKIARHFASLRISQWEHVANAEGCQYMGAII
jgi:hypothetical protein